MGCRASLFVGFKEEKVRYEDVGNILDLLGDFGSFGPFSNHFYQVWNFLVIVKSDMVAVYGRVQSVKPAPYIRASRPIFELLPGLLRVKLSFKHGTDGDKASEFDGRRGLIPFLFLRSCAEREEEIQGSSVVWPEFQTLLVRNIQTAPSVTDIRGLGTDSFLFTPRVPCVLSCNTCSESCD